jgi:hypothetical protein
MGGFSWTATCEQKARGARWDAGASDEKRLVPHEAVALRAAGPAVTETVCDDRPEERDGDYQEAEQHRRREYRHHRRGFARDWTGVLRTCCERVHPALVTVDPHGDGVTPGGRFVNDNDGVAGSFGADLCDEFTALRCRRGHDQGTGFMPAGLRSCNMASGDDMRPSYERTAHGDAKHYFSE